MKLSRELLERHADLLIALGLCLGYLALLLVTASSLGFMRDEGFYFSSARVYQRWFDLLLHEPGQALSRQGVQDYWSVNHEHPGLMKSLFALSNAGLAGLFGETSTSFRFPAMVLSSAAPAVIYSWGRRALGRAGALVAA